MRPITTPQFHSTPPVGVRNTSSDQGSSVSEQPIEIRTTRPGDGVEVQRNVLLSNLHDIRDHLLKLRSENWETSKIESSYDHALMPLIAKAEKKRNPDSHATFALDAFEKLEQYRQADKLTVVTNLPDGNYSHFVAMDVRNTKDGMSVIVLDSLSPSYYDNGMGKNVRKKNIKDAVPSDAKVSIMCLGSQNSSTSCRIFALSAASKASKAEGYMDELHNTHLGLSSNTLQDVSQAHEADNSEGITVYEYPKTIPAEFLKHTHSRSHLSKNYSEQKNEIVNKQGLTLETRQQDHLVRRFQTNISDGLQWGLKSLTYSASIEDKRIQYVGRAIDYVQDATAGEIQELDGLFNDLVESSEMPSQAGLRLGQRCFDLGPKQAMQELVDEQNRPLSAEGEIWV